MLPKLQRIARHFWPLASLLAAASTCLGAETPSDWPRFRGPNGSGIGAVTGLPATWTEKDYRWKTSLPGAGHASPVVTKGKIFTLCADKETARRLLVCLSTGDGSVLWKREFESATFPKNRDNSYAASTPAVDGERVYAYWTTREEVTVLAIDHSGTQLWRRNLGPYRSQHGSGASLALFQDLVLVNNDQEGPSSLIALDAKTGATRWETQRVQNRAAYSTPCVRPTDAGKPELIFSSSGHGISGLDPLTGKVNWELTNAFPFRVVGSPVLAGGVIVGACGEGGIGRRVVAVRPASSQRAAELAWEMKNSIPYVPTPLYVSGLLLLLCDNGLLTCHRPESGEQIWKQKISDSFYASPVSAGGKVYCVSKRGTVYVLGADDKGEALGTVALGEPSFATPAIAEGAIFFRTESSLFCLPGKK